MASFVALQEAQEKLAELIDRAKGGEEIVIEQNGKAAAKLVPVATVAAERKKPRIGGQNLLGITYIAPDFDAPMSEEELKHWIPSRRTLADCIAMLPENSTATVDDDFAKDVEAGIEAHRDPADSSAWD
jgi:prevent-host-death family protein